MDGEKFRERLIAAVWTAEGQMLEVGDLHERPDVQAELGIELACSSYVTADQVGLLVKEGVLRFTDSTRQAVTFTRDGARHVEEMQRESFEVPHD